MIRKWPERNVLYAALLARDPSYEGRVYSAVRTTGIFCRLTCTARKPLFKNTLFFPSIEACLAEGFRPCRRCRPLDVEGAPGDMILTLLAALDGNASSRWLERDIAALGYEPSTVRRAFKRQFGRTFLAIARERRLKLGQAALASGGRVIDAQLEAGFDSSSGFRAAARRVLGQPPLAMTIRRKKT
jgi:AraC family transcriptional regulator, regulatory protein of adaptative response / methylated-DNA-[protein]-cysteine methyltransferase